MKETHTENRDRADFIENLAAAIYLRLQEGDPWPDDVEWKAADACVRMNYMACAERLLLDHRDLFHKGHDLRAAIDRARETPPFDQPPENA